MASRSRSRPLYLPLGAWRIARVSALCAMGHRGGGLVSGESRECLVAVMSGQVAQGCPADFLSHRLEHMTAFGDGRLGAAVEADVKPVVDRLPNGVGGRSLNVGGDLLPQGPQLDAHLGPGAAADRAALALAGGGVTEGHRPDPVSVGMVKVEAIAVPLTDLQAVAGLRNHAGFRYSRLSRES